MGIYIQALVCGKAEAKSRLSAKFTIAVKKSSKILQTLFSSFIIDCKRV